MEKINKERAKFAFGDTILATPINLLLNYVFLTIGFSMEMTPEQLAPFLTATFFCFAIVRKYVLLKYFGRGL